MPDSPVPGSRQEAAAEALASVPHVPGAPKPDPILVANNVLRRFGGLTAVNVDHVEIQRGAITALIGPNGAGKTTFFNLLTGFDTPDEGSWMFKGRELAGLPASWRPAILDVVGESGEVWLADHLARLCGL